MSRQLFTAADIRAQKHGLLLLGSDDIITPEAVDVAREIGVKLVREDSASMTLENNFQTLSQQVPIQLQNFPLKMVLGSRVVLDPFGEGLATPGTNVRLKDVVTSTDGSPMAAGYMELDKGEFPWTLNYDEIDIVLDGELVITRGDVSVHGMPGDVIFIPKGSNIFFGTPTKVRFIYVAFPANWNELT